MPRKHHKFTAISSRLSLSQLILFSCKGEVHHHVSGNQVARKESTRVSQDELMVALQWQNARWHEVILARLTSGARAVCCRCEMSQVNTMPCLLILCSWLSSPECSFTPSLWSLYRVAMDSLRWQLSVCHAWCRAGLRWETIDADQSNEQALEWTVSWKFDRNPVRNHSTDSLPKNMCIKLLDCWLQGLHCRNPSNKCTHSKGLGNIL